MIDRTYLDVDGVINSLNPLFGDYWPVPAEHRWAYEALGFVLHVPDYMATLIQALDHQTEIVWCTTWEHDANEWIAPIVEIDHRRVLERPADDESLHWKEQLVLDDMATNPCEGAIWIEDFGYSLDERFADAGVMPIDTTLAPPGSTKSGQSLNVLLPDHLMGLDLTLPHATLAAALG